MSDINDATRYLDEDGLLTLADRIEDVYAKKTDVSKSIQATYEQSPTLAAHVADEYLYIKTGSSTHVTYKTLTSIAANTELVVGTNVKVFDDTGIPVYVDKVPGAGGAGAVITAADVSYDDGTVDDALTELNSNLLPSFSTTSDGIKTWGQIFNNIYSLIDKTKITNRCRIVRKNVDGGLVSYGFIISTPTFIVFSYSYIDNDNNNTLSTYTATMKTTGSTFKALAGSLSDVTNNVPGAGITFDVYY